MFLQFIDGQERVYQQAPVREFLHPAHLADVMFILDLSHQFFQQILRGGEAAQDAVLVDDQRHLDAFALHLPKEAAHLLPLRDEQRGADDPGDVERFFGAQVSDQDVLRVDEADHMVHVAPDNRIARVHVLPDGPEDLLLRLIEVDGDDPGPWHHDLADKGV